MRRQNRAPALACLDQPEILRYVFRALREDALAPKCVDDAQSCVVGIDPRAGMQARANAACHSPSCCIDTLESVKHSITCYRRTNLHVWCANEERHALLKARSWSSAMLATQRRESDAAAGEARD